jgi:hypothetical protein
MSVKMKIARCGDKEYRTDEYHTEFREQLQCRYCDAKVVFVGDYKYTRGERVVVVHKYYRLGKDEQHGNKCPYNIERQLENIFSRRADPQLLSKEGDHYVVRLLIQNETNQKLHVVKDLDICGKVVTTEPNYINVGNKTAYITSILKIIQLRKILVDKKELNNKVLLKVKTANGEMVQVEWKDFCFEEDDLPRLYNLIKGKKLRSDICLVGHAYKNNFGQIAIKNKVSANKQYVFEAELDGLCIDERTIKDHVICVYMSELWCKEPKQSKKCGIEYYNICGKIVSEKQMLVIEE